MSVREGREGRGLFRARRSYRCIAEDDISVTSPDISTLWCNPRVVVLPSPETASDYQRRVVVSSAQLRSARLRSSNDHP